MHDLTKTQQEQSDSYRLRYKVYVEEMGLECPHADHVNKHIIDELDDFGYIFNQYRDGECVSTLRGNVVSEGDIGSLKGAYSIDSTRDFSKTAILTKFVVSKKHRRSLAAYNVIRDAYIFGLSKGVNRAYMDSVPNLLSYYEKLGFIACGEEFINDETGLAGQPMYIQMDDLDHLQNISSPLGKLYNQFNSMKQDDLLSVLPANGKRKK